MRDANEHPGGHDRVEPFPPGTSVIHVGPHKTGTTAVQAALHAARDRLAEHGVRLPSPKRNPVDEVGEGVAPAPRDPARPTWSGLAAAFARDDGTETKVVSSEYFADADAEAAGRVVEDLGAERAHVVVTLRPLTKILPSQWQQHVQSGMSTKYEDWLTELLKDDPDDRAARVFWHRHRHDRFVRRWADAAGPERVTVLVVDDSRPDRLLRDFEAMLGVPERTLVAADNAANRSLTAGEIEAVRLCAEARLRRGWSLEFFRRYVRYGAVPRIKTGRRPLPGEARIATPEWARMRAAEIGASIAEGVAASGVRVIGDLELLRGEVEAEPPGGLHLDPALTAAAILGCMTVALKEREAASADIPVQRQRGGSLFAAVGRRARARFSRGG
ncbi:hypothetical protein GCM10027447_08760 [Glycomyces halotolerans]